MSICSATAAPSSRSPAAGLCTDQYNNRFMFTEPDLLEMHRRMLVIRGFEQRVAALYRDGEVPGFVHLSIGQEAAAVGACWPLGPNDVITSTHRGHGHCLAKGLDPLGMFAELMAKDAGHQSRARRLDAHRRSVDRHLRRQRHRRRPDCRSPRVPQPRRSFDDDGTVAVAFFGDGAVAHGTFHEAVNLAAVWQLPVIFFCENNGYAEFSLAAAQHGASLEQRACRLRRRLRRGRRQRRRGDCDRDAPRSSTRPAPGAVRSSSRPPRTAGTATTKAIRSGTDRRRSFRSGKRATRCSCTRADCEPRASPTTRSTPCSPRSRASSTTAVDVGAAA